MGFPSPADDYKESPLHLDDLIVHPSATYFIKMTGVAMEPTIHHGDILVVDRALTPLDYQINTLARVFIECSGALSNWHATRQFAFG